MTSNSEFDNNFDHFHTDKSPNDNPINLTNENDNLTDSVTPLVIPLKTDNSYHIPATNKWKKRSVPNLNRQMVNKLSRTNNSKTTYNQVSSPTIMETQSKNISITQSKLGNATNPPNVQGMYLIAPFSATNSSTPQFQLPKPTNVSNSLLFNEQKNPTQVETENNITSDQMLSEMNNAFGRFVVSCLRNMPAKRANLARLRIVQTLNDCSSSPM
ncbi:hypothetical protein BLOT_002555 [Blomia tropicalis]|nr:hypothetical protein BLOT_002555 [Blomia tropicalis]